jgi:glycosyltransferase involved in cell wall biosynthesis
VFERESFDVVVCHSSWPHAVFAPEVRRVEAPLVYWAHGTPSGHWLERLADRTPPDLVVANSAYTLSKHAGLFSGVEKSVLRLPVSPRPIVDREQTRREVRSELKTDDGDVVIVCFSRLEAWKGHSLLLDALARARDFGRWTAWIAGGPQRETERIYLAELHREVSRHGLDSRVRFIGQRSDIPRILEAADIHCQPNTGPEPFGIAFIEALYAGLPVVTTAMGGALEIVTQDCGLLVQPDADELAAALRKLATDGDLRRKLGSHARHRARELCDPGVTIPGIELSFNELLSKRFKIDQCDDNR